MRSTAPVPWTVAALVALVLSAVLAGCGTATAPAAPAGGAVRPETSAAPVAPPRIVMVIRHGEKPEGSEPGVDADGNEDDSSLTEVGWDRARALVDFFDPPQGPARPGLERPVAIYAAGANENGEGARTRQTVLPLAADLGIATNTSFGKGDEEALVEHVLAGPGPALISWSHSGIPAIAEAFPSVSPSPPAEWPDDRFDVVWTFTESADGWRFAQVPELVLPGDDADVIEN
jgi:hypothetical protein